MLIKKQSTVVLFFLNSSSTKTPILKTLHLVQKAFTLLHDKTVAFIIKLSSLAPPGLLRII